MSAVSILARPHASSAAPTLRGLLAFDAATCLGMGVLLVAAGTPLASLLGLPAALLGWAGLLLFPSAALMAAGAARRRPPTLLVRLVVAGNAAWVLASVAVLVLTAPTLLGIAVVLAQALAVAVLAALERRALRALA
jgi:hypothetical protein